MVRLTAEFVTEGVPLTWEVGEFASREDAEGAAKIIQEEAEAADEDVTFTRFRIEAMAGAV